jgi:hypothetical protein
MEKLTLGQLYYLATKTINYRHAAIMEMLKRIPSKQSFEKEVIYIDITRNRKTI